VSSRSQGDVAPTLVGPAPAKGGLRAAKAAATRAKILAAARQQFVKNGYVATTMPTIAKEAGVAVQTLYFTFGTKKAILTEVVDVAVAGDTAPIATLDRPWVEQALAAPPADMLRMLVTAATEIHERVGPVLDVVRSAAAVDPDIAELWRTNIAQRHTVATLFAGALAAKTTLREGVNAARAADITLAILTPETYQLLVADRGWTRQDWAHWATGALICQLLPNSSSD
jgi:AcrR family transcriptional regulator